MFSKLKVNIPIRAPIQRLVVSNDIILVALNNNSIYRIDQRQPDKCEGMKLILLIAVLLDTKFLFLPAELDIGKPMSVPMRIVGVFLDPYGQHALISVASKHGDAQPELLFSSGKSLKFKQSSRARGFEVTAVAWNHLSDSAATTGPLLLGTSKGMVFECEFLAETDRIFQMSWEKCWREVPYFFKFSRSDDLIFQKCAGL
jgi:hypothetical protein